MKALYVSMHPYNAFIHILLLSDIHYLLLGYKIFSRESTYVHYYDTHAYIKYVNVDIISLCTYR